MLTGQQSGFTVEDAFEFACKLRADPMGMNDPGEPVQDGSIIVAKYGKGNFIYTGISFFRQLPAGVPGAYRLLVNLLNAGK